MTDNAGLTGFGLGAELVAIFLLFLLIAVVAVERSK
jgi:hypothetical protein